MKIFGRRLSLKNVAKKTLDWSLRAKKNILEIHDYIALDNPDAANRVLLALRQAAENLIDFPMLGKASEVAGLRELNLTQYPYTIAYRLTASQVTVAAVTHQSRAHRL